MKLRQTAQFIEARRGTITRAEFNALPSSSKLKPSDCTHVPPGYYILVNNGGTELWPVKVVDELPYSVQRHMQEIDWCWTRLGRLNHTYSILRTRFSNLIDRGTPEQIDKALARLQRLERLIDLEKLIEGLY